MLVLIIAAMSSSHPGECALPFEVVGNEAAARAVARVVIASAPAKLLDPQARDKDILGYARHIRYLSQRGSWIVYEAPISAVKGVRIMGGGGLAMEIAACDGAVSDISRQR